MVGPHWHNSECKFTEKEKSPVMYIYIPCTCTLLFIYWGIFSVYICTVIFCRDLVYRAFRGDVNIQVDEMKDPKIMIISLCFFFHIRSKCLVLLTICFCLCSTSLTFYCKMLDLKPKALRVLWVMRELRPLFFCKRNFLTFDAKWKNSFHFLSCFQTRVLTMLICMGEK